MNSEIKDKEFYIYDASHRFAAMYPLLARQILEDHGQGRRSVLDIGTGGAPLLIEMAKISDIALTGLDRKAEVLEFAAMNMDGHGIPRERISLVCGDVTGIPMPDAAFDLVVSRGSIPFWEDMAGAFAEIYRVLAPGGLALVGCGFSRYQPREEIKRMRPEWSQKGNDDPRNEWKREGRIQDALAEAGIEGFRVTKDACGVWIEIDKPGTGG